jgi:hypothetical protein
VAAGALADRFDPRRLIQCGMVRFMTCSLGWGGFFITDSNAPAHPSRTCRRCLADLKPTPAARHCKYCPVAKCSTPQRHGPHARSVVGPAVTVVFYLPLLLCLQGALRF